MSRLFVKFAYPIEDPAAYEIVDTDMKESGIIEVLEAFIHGSIGAGPDPRKPNELEVYKLRVDIDLTCDRIVVKSDCGQKGLELGILMDILTRMTQD
jgi:hypothetical protein